MRTLQSQQSEEVLKGSWMHISQVSLSLNLSVYASNVFLHKAVLLVPCAVSPTSHLVVLNRVMSGVGYLKINGMCKQESFDEKIYLKPRHIF